MEENGHVGAISNSTEQHPAKIFVGGLHSQSDEGSLQRYFEKYGEIKECVVMRDATTKRSRVSAPKVLVKRSKGGSSGTAKSQEESERGFGFIVYKDPISVEKVLDKALNDQCPYHMVDGKKVDPKKAIPRKVAPHQHYKKVFVGGLPGDITAKEITEYFEVYGKVNEVLLMHDKTTKRLRGFGFVTFENETAGKTVCEAGFHKLKGKNVECKKAQPKEVMMLQGKGRDLLVNLAPFPFNRNFPNGITSPVTFGIPDWSASPQLYQQLVNWMSLGRGKAYANHNYCPAPQGFGSMPDHRRNPNSQQYFTDYSNSASNTTTVTSADTLSPQTQDYDHSVHQIHQFQSQQPSNTVVQTGSVISQSTSRQPDMASFLPSRTPFGGDQQTIYHGAQALQSSQPFGHSLPITLRH